MTDRTEQDSTKNQPKRRNINIHGSLMDKEMFYALLSNFDGDAYLSSINFVDLMEPRK